MTYESKVPVVNIQSSHFLTSSVYTICHKLEHKIAIPKYD